MAKPPDPLRAYQQALRRHRATLDRLLDRRSAVALKRFYDKAQDDLERRLGKMARETRNAALSPLQAQQLLAQVYAAQRALMAKLQADLIPVLSEAQTAGIEETDETITQLEKERSGTFVALPLDDVAVVASLKEKRRGALISSTSTAFTGLAARLNVKAQEQMAMSLTLEETAGDAIDRLRQNADAEWWQGERVIVTEMAKAYNSAQADSIDLAAQEMGQIYKRWTELVDDATGMPMDNRVGKDSIALHGQVTPQDGVFVMPPDPTVHRSFWNQRYFSSPNRPNDRSVTMPWRPSWGVPGWEWKDARRVDIPLSRR